MNIVAILVAALISLPIGFIWYNPSVFGNAWLKAIGKTQEDLKGKTISLPLLLLCSLFFAFLISLMLSSAVIHQSGLHSLLVGMPGAENGKVELLLNGKVIEYQNLFRTFKHGALHGVIVALFFALPIIAQSALYEGRKFKYIAITAGYWIVTLAIMGGIICAWQ